MRTLQAPMLRRVAGDGLAALGVAHPLDEDGRFYVRGERPGPDWHAHGTFPSSLVDLRRGKRVRLPLRKQRWRLKGTNITRSARAADDLGLRHSALVVAVQLWAWLDAGLGLHNVVPLFDDLADRPCRRTLQRWLARFQPRALEVQHHVRHAVLSRIEPRPLEALFPRGLPPPPRTDGRWREPSEVHQLHRALAILLVSAASLDCQASLLLAEARRKADHRTTENG